MISVEDLALTTLAGLFGLYGLFCAAFCGASLVRVFPKITTSSKRTKLQRTAWEAGNAFLLLGLGGFALLFNNAFELLGPQLDYLVILGLLAVLIRSAILLWINGSARPSQITKPIKLLFAIVSLAVPLCLAAAGTYLLYGEQFWQAPGAWLLVLSAGFGACAIGLVLVNAKKIYQRTLAAVWLLTLGCLWPLSLTMTGSHLLDYWFGLWLSFVIVVTSVVLVTDGLAKRSYLRLAVPGLAFLAVPLLASANNPYLVYGQLTTAAGFSAGNWPALVGIGCVVVWGLIIYGLWVVFRLCEPRKSLNAKL